MKYRILVENYCKGDGPVVVRYLAQYRPRFWPFWSSHYSGTEYTRDCHWINYDISAPAWKPTREKAEADVEKMRRQHQKVETYYSTIKA